MKIVAEFNSIQEIKDFAVLIGGQKELVIKADYIKPEMVQEPNNVDAVQEVAPEKEEPKVEETTKEVASKKEEIPTVEAEVVGQVDENSDVVEEAQEVKKISKDEVRGIFSKLIQNGKQKQAKELTNKYGAKKISDIKEEDYEAIYSEAEGLL